MATDQGVMGDTTYVAGADYRTAGIYLFVKKTTADLVVTAGAGERAIGVLQNKPNSAEGAAVRTIPGTFTKLYVDGSGTAIAAGDPLKSNASGQGVKATADGDEVCAYADEASTAAGDIIRARIANRQL